MTPVVAVIMLVAGVEDVHLVCKVLVLLLMIVRWVVSWWTPLRCSEG